MYLFRKIKIHIKWVRSRTYFNWIEERDFIDLCNEKEYWVDFFCNHCLSNWICQKKEVIHSKVKSYKWIYSSLCISLCKRSHACVYVCVLGERIVCDSSFLRSILRSKYFKVITNIAFKMVQLTILRGCKS